MNLNNLRTVLEERPAKVTYNPDENIIVAGEQKRKLRTLDAKNITFWEGFCTASKSVHFASFIPPGRYSVKHPWGNEFERIEKLEKTIVRKIRSPATEKTLGEIELVFRNGKTNEQNRFIVSGIDFQALPQLPPDQYPKGLYMPMGIGVPPFYQSYEELQQNPPYLSPYFSLLLDEEDRWINHHDTGIDGPVIHRDYYDPNILHLYLLSYERQTLVGHFTITLEQEMWNPTSSF